MKKRIVTALLALVLLLGLSVSVFAESQLWHITDDAGILTEAQDGELEAYAENISQNYGVGLYVVTVSNANLLPSSMARARNTPSTSTARNRWKITSSMISTPMTGQTASSTSSPAAKSTSVWPKKVIPSAEATGVPSP